MKTILRIVGTGSALVLAAFSLTSYIGWKAEHVRALELLRRTELDRRLPEVAKRVDREPDPVWARLSISRILLAEGFDQSWLLNLPPDEAKREIAEIDNRLVLARKLAAEVLDERPATWEAAMVIGGSTILELLRRGDPQLVTARQTWEEPLRAASDLAPGKYEPSRLLAAAYLAIWPTLSLDEQQEAKAVLGRAFKDEATFERLAEMWLRVAGSREETLALVPERPYAWRTLQKIFARRADWESFVETYRRWDKALLADLKRSQDEAEVLLRGGDVFGARSLMLEIAATSRPDRRYLSVVSRALERCPPGPPMQRYSQALNRFLLWALEDCVLGECRIAGHLLRRLAAASRNLPPEQEALVHLAAGDFAAADVFERRAEALSTESWAPYLVFKARLLAESGDPEAARSALDPLFYSWRGREVEIKTRLAIAHAASDSVAEAAAERELRDLAKFEWTGIDWSWQGSIARVNLLPAEPAEGVEIALDVIPLEGAAIEIRWDQEMVKVAAVYPGESVRLELKVTPEPHILELESIGGGKVLPGTVQLLGLSRTSAKVPTVSE